MKKALLLQLPVPGFSWPVLDANIPLAAGYLAAWAQCRSRDWRVEILPWSEVDVLGDEALFLALLARAPDLVGFSLYLWNAERSLHLARRLSDVGIPVLVGGPEVEPENDWLWGSRTFQAAVSGEGEESFVRVLDALSRGASLEGVSGLHLGAAPKNALATCPWVDLAQLPSPYLRGLLDPSPDGTVWLETLRGCPFRCAYCRYGKSYRSPRSFPPDWIPRHLAWASKRDVAEIYLMDPSFNVRPDWEEVLGALEHGNRERRIALHTELVADVLRPGDAARLAGAGLRSCEIGLQTVRGDALARVRRSWNRKRWLRGVRELLQAEVSVSVGLIVGLPGDDLAGFEETLSFLREQVPAANLQAFPLALLPGTELRARADECGLVASPIPPYTVTRTAGYEPEDLRRAFDLFEEATGLELDPLGAPPIGGSWEGSEANRSPYLSGVRIEAAQVSAGWAEAVAMRAAQNLCVWIRGWCEGVPLELGRLSSLLPHGVLTVVFEDGAEWPPERLSSVLREAGTGAHYLDRYFRLLYGQGARVVPRLVVLVEGSSRPQGSWLEEIRTRADVVWAVEVSPGWQLRARDAAREGELVYVRGEPPKEDLRKLARSLPDGAGEILFAAGSAVSAWRSVSRPPESSNRSKAFRADEHRLTLR